MISSPKIRPNIVDADGVSKISNRPRSQAFIRRANAEERFRKATVVKFVRRRPEFRS